MSSLMTRLQRLEARTAHRNNEPTEDDLIGQKLWEHLAASMDPVHLYLAMEAAKTDWAESCNSPGFWLLMQMVSLIETCVQNPKIPCVMPPEVTQVFLDDPKALFLHDCADCGYPIPLRPGQQVRSTQTPPYRYFESCPLCSGRVGYCAYYHNHESQGESPKGSGL